MKVVTAHEVKRRLMVYAFYERNHAAVVTEGLNGADVLAISQERLAIEYEVKTSRGDLNRELAAIRYATMTMKEGKSLGPVSDGPEQEQLNLEFAGLKKKAGNGWTKITKHEQYIDPAKYFEEHKRFMLLERYIPNYFNLVVPRTLVDYALEQTEGTGYGVMAYDGCRSEGKHYGWFSDGIWYDYRNRPDNAVHRRGAPCEPGRCTQEITVKRRAKRIHEKPVDDGVMMSILRRTIIENITMLDRLVELKEDVNALHKKNSELRYE